MSSDLDWVCVHCNQRFTRYQAERAPCTAHFGKRGCSWHPGLGPGESVCSRCGVDVLDPYALPSQRQGCTRCDHCPPELWALAAREPGRPLYLPTFLVTPHPLYTATTTVEAKKLLPWQRRMEQLVRAEHAFHQKVNNRILAEAKLHAEQLGRTLRAKEERGGDQACIAVLPYQAPPEAAAKAAAAPTTIIPDDPLTERICALLLVEQRGKFTEPPDLLLGQCLKYYPVSWSYVYLTDAIKE